MDFIDDKYPELKESEDERIRKELIEQVIYIVPNDDEVDNEGNVLPTYQKRIDKYRAWLEKQGERKFAWSDKDEKERKRVVGLLEGWLSTFKETCYAEDCKFGIEWLKSLKQRMKGETK